MTYYEVQYRPYLSQCNNKFQGLNKKYMFCIYCDNFNMFRVTAFLNKKNSELTSLILNDTNFGVVKNRRLWFQYITQFVIFFNTSKSLQRLKRWFLLERWQVTPRFCKNRFNRGTLKLSKVIFGKPDFDMPASSKN